MANQTARRLDLQQRQELFDRLNRWINAQPDAAIISAPGSRRVRFACAAGSPVPERLKGFGYCPRYIGPETRIIMGKFEPVSVYEITTG
jgi:hypothetical protein